MPELKRDHQPLQRPQHTAGQNDREWQPENQVHPDRRLVGQFDEQHQADNDEADDHDDKDCRAVAAVSEGIVKSTGHAGFLDAQETVKKLSLATTWTLARQAGSNRIDRWEMRLVFHDVPQA